LLFRQGTKKANHLRRWDAKLRAWRKSGGLVADVLEPFIRLCFRLRGEAEMKGILKLILVLAVVFIPCCAYSGSLPITKTGKVSVRVIGSDTINIASEVLPAVPLVPAVQDEQSVTVSAKAKNSQDVVQVTFNFYSQRNYKIQTAFVTDGNETTGETLEKNTKDQTVSFNFVSPRDKNLQKVIYTFVSL
jgi:hypothetical protein